MARFLLYAIPLVVMLYALIDALQTPRGLARTLPRWLWLVVIVLVPLIGAVAWLAWGRAPQPAYGDPSPAAGGRRRNRGSTAPDDDATFLRRLDDEAWQRKMRERREGGLPDPGDASGPTSH